MAHRVAWSRRALSDLEEIADYIAADSPTYAAIVVQKIVNLAKTLRQFPRAGRKVPEFDDENVRELIAYSYRVIYRLQADEIISLPSFTGSDLFNDFETRSAAALRFETSSLWVRIGVRPNGFPPHRPHIPS